MFFLISCIHNHHYCYPYDQLSRDKWDTYQISNSWEIAGKSSSIILRTDFDLSVTKTRILTPELKRKVKRDFREKTSISAEQLTWMSKAMYLYLELGSIIFNTNLILARHHQPNHFSRTQILGSIIIDKTLNQSWIPNLEEICTVWCWEPWAVKSAIPSESDPIIWLSLKLIILWLWFPRILATCSPSCLWLSQLAAVASSNTSLDIQPFSDTDRKLKLTLEVHVKEWKSSENM